ncbi:hypothetical protein [Inquilinus sp. Marseille-Q2685]|uniref:hypothetical protein n=1 Tax=Inquilinus sp. Marseille-Q2685 TaxID=2866581 RepID=UPI001CE3F21D|nr:hypothetical protein [Inquilinus sp. Marseille-Q2685]
MAVTREVRERDGLKLYRNALSRRLLAAEGTAAMLQAALREFPDLLGFDLWRHPSGALMLCRTDNRPAALAKDKAWAMARPDVLFAPVPADTMPAAAALPRGFGEGARPAFA